MRVLVSKHGIISHGLPEHLEGWHLDVVRYRRVERLIATMAKVRAYCRKELLRFLDSLQHRPILIDLGCLSVHLRSIEY